MSNGYPPPWRITRPSRHGDDWVYSYYYGTHAKRDARRKYADLDTTPRYLEKYNRTTKTWEAA